jgi:L-aspartate oxidase
MALRSGVAVADVEFVQFHPTALHHPRMPRPLLSEALRGHGALLRDIEGERFVDELLPRDAVSRAMTRRMLDLGVDHCWLDATGLEHFDTRFPTIADALHDAGLDPATDWLPIAPAAHYLCGGVLADLDGATSLPNLWAAGEVACSGVHGANRLASNSLLEGMVFGFRVIEAIDRGKAAADPTGAMRSLLQPTGGPGIGGRLAAAWAAPAWRPPAASVERPDRTSTSSGAGADARVELQRAMTTGAGVLRSASSLATTAGELATVRATVDDGVDERDRWELRNLADVSAAVVASAGERLESRGAHTRIDHPESDPAYRLRLVLGPLG